MKEYAEGFYKSRTWQRCRDQKYKQARGLCERCLAKGIYKPGEIVHHITELTRENINNPDVTLNMDNLQLLCRDCHADVHKGYEKRYTVDELGRITIK